MTDADEAALKKSAALLPVFEDGDSLTVVLPEVRVECRRSEGAEHFGEWLEQLPADVEVHERRKGQWVIASVTAEQALDIANDAHERLDVELAQPRLLRIVPKSH